MRSNTEILINLREINLKLYRIVWNQNRRAKIIKLQDSKSGALVIQDFYLIISDSTGETILYI